MINQVTQKFKSYSSIWKTSSCVTFHPKILMNELFLIWPMSYTLYIYISLKSKQGTSFGYKLTVGMLYLCVGLS